ncbi:MAG: HAD-IIA family hydrolase [Actinomycetota bacterium]|nr:HAD-IIA family hydrolase [Actinomycetota bacterium]
MALLDGYEGLIIDLDGTVFRLEEPIEPAIEFLRRVELPMVFVTNNSTRKAVKWAEMLADAGVEVAEERVLTSAMAAAAMLSEDSPRVYPIGEEGLADALALEGIETTDNYEDAEAVVVGWDRRLTWDKLRTATLAIHHGARFIATNRDPVYPTVEGPWPGNGAALAAICEATNATPEVAGKPETPMFELAAERLGGGRVLVVGDQISSDIRTAERLGWDSVLALTGVSTWQSLVGAVATPTWVVADLGELDGPRATRVRAGNEGDLPRLRDLVERVGRRVDAPLDSSTDACIAEDPEGELVAAVGWEELEQGVVVRWIIHDGQREDAAAHVLARALDSLGRTEVSSIYRLGKARAGLFAQLGFERLSIDEAPEELREGAEADVPLLVRRFEREASER